MSLYTADDIDTLRARTLLKQWTAEGLLNQAQHDLLEQDTPSDLRTTNIFLRVVLFFFTLLVIAAATGLFFEIFLSHPSRLTDGIVFLVFAALTYTAAEIAVAQARFFHYGIEEALAVSSLGFCFAGLQMSFGSYTAKPYPPEFIIPTLCVLLALWIWRRFTLWYAFVAAMLLTALIPGFWTSSPSAQHALVSIFYAAGLLGIATLRPRTGFLTQPYSLAEALLWLGTYLALNLKLSALPAPLFWRFGGISPSELTRPFYWLTWILIWCLPPLILARGILQKARPILIVGGLTALLTFISNKPYLGWPRHAWNPILLGMILIAVALYLRRWLASGPHGIRHGFTAARLSGKDKHWLEAASAAAGLLTPHSPNPQPATPAPPLEGGTSGGAGASRNF